MKHSSVAKTGKYCKKLRFHCTVITFHFKELKKNLDGHMFLIFASLILLNCPFYLFYLAFKRC